MVTVTSGGKVFLKIVAGCNGYKAAAVAEKLKKKWPVITLKQAYKIARKGNFGCEECLVIMSNEEELSKNGEITPLFRETFDRPKFNPRWSRGTADHVKVVEV